MKTFALFVTSSPFATNQVLQALLFARHQINNGNKIAQVFFYADAVLIANRFLTADSAKDNLHLEWVKFAQEHNIPLNVCITASLKRGVLGSEEAKYANLPPNLFPPFHQVGMTDFFSALAGDDSIESVQF